MTAAPADPPAAPEPLRAAEAALLFRPLASEDALIVAVSGGPDSVALLALLAEWASGARRRLLAVTIDHGLRPDSARDADFVRALGRRLGVPVEVAAVAVGMLLRLGFTLAGRVPRRIAAYAVMAATFLAVGVLNWPLVPVVAVLAPISILAAWPRKPTRSGHA